MNNAVAYGALHLSDIMTKWYDFGKDVAMLLVISCSIFFKEALFL